MMFCATTTKKHVTSLRMPLNNKIKFDKSEYYKANRKVDFFNSQCVLRHYAERAATLRLRVVQSSRVNYISRHAPPNRPHPGREGVGVEPVFTSGFPVYGRAWKQPLQLPYNLSASSMPRKRRFEPLSVEAWCFGDRRAAIVQDIGREITAALDDHSRQKVSFAKRQSQCGPRSESWSWSTGPAVTAQTLVINTLSFAEDA